MTIPRAAGAIVGAYEHPTRKAVGMNQMLFAFEAARGALADAGLESRDIDAIFTPPMLTEGGPLGPSASLVMTDYLGIKARFLDETDVGGASFGFYLNRALLAIEAGLIRCALIVYAAQPRTRGRRAGAGAGTGEFNPTPDSFEQVYGIPLVGFYGIMATRYLHETGLTREQLAAVPVTVRRHASLNPQALYRDPLTVEDVLGSPMVASPLHLYDCCVVSDGAAAVIVASPDIAERLERPPVWVLGGGESTMSHRAGHGDWSRDTVAMVGEAADDAFAGAGVDRKALDAAMIYDAFSINVVMALEGAGLCPQGEIGEFVASGQLGAGGALPINTDGGGLSSNHPGRRGLFLLVEAVRQLRGEGPGAQVEDAELVATIATGAASLARRTSAVHVLGVNR
jgi:acetyl-CoA C-acetyltransferase